MKTFMLFMLCFHLCFSQVLQADVECRLVRLETYFSGWFILIIPGRYELDAFLQRDTLVCDNLLI